MRGRRRARGGFTLIELMVVVAILGITAAVVLANFRRNSAGAEARRIASAMATAYRTAMNGGPVRAQVSAAEGGTRARAMLQFEESGEGYIVTVWKLKEDDAPSTAFSWLPIETAAISTDVEILSVSDSATIGLSASVITAGVFPATKYYFPNGSADPFTVYIRDKKSSSPTSRYRVVGLPLSPAPQVFQDW